MLAELKIWVFLMWSRVYSSATPTMVAEIGTKIYVCNAQHF
jgi:hypothetical protein